MIDAVVLCGGHGTRLYPETRSLPKALVRVAQRPIIEWVIDHLVAQGAPRIVLCTGVRAEKIREHVSLLGSSAAVQVDPRTMRSHVVGPRGSLVEVLVCDTGVDTPTGARLHQVERHLRGDALITYADVLADVSVAQLMEVHRKAGSTATLTVTNVHSPYGHVNISDTGIVHGFDEKPRLAQPVNIGFMVLAPGTRARLSATSRQLEEGLLPSLADEGRLASYSHPGGSTRWTRSPTSSVSTRCGARAASSGSLMC